MKGVVVGGALLVVAMLLIGRGWTLQRQEHARAKRLVPVRARVTDQGSQPIPSIFMSSDGSQRQDIDYEGRYEYIVGGTRYPGRISSAVPVFRSDQMPPAGIDVFYDSANPSVSRVSRDTDSTGRSYMLFGAVVLAVALGVAVISNLPP